MMTRVQILDEAVGVSLRDNPLGKGMKTFVLLLTMTELLERLGFLPLVQLTGPWAEWAECSPMVRETGVQNYNG